MSFTVDHEELRAHAGKLAGYADKLATTGGGLPSGVAEQSLGGFAQFLSTGLSGAMAETMDAFKDVAAAVDRVGDGMRNTADQYQRTDDTNAVNLTKEGAR